MRIDAENHDVAAHSLQQRARRWLDPKNRTAKEHSPQAVESAG